MSKSIPYNTYSHNFGILIPDDTGVTFTHQSGGMSCTQIDLEGVFLPMKPPQMMLDYPEWADWDEDVSELDLTASDIPNRDFESFPEWVQERGYFYNIDEYHYWLNQEHVDWYGNLDLIEEMRLWSYDPSGDLHEEVRGYNPAEKWDSLEHIWMEINKRLPFNYEKFDVWDYKRQVQNEEDIDYEDVDIPLPDGYPTQGAAFEWIKILRSKTDNHDRIRAQWAEELKGEYVIMTYDNCD